MRLVDAFELESSFVDERKMTLGAHRVASSGEDGPIESLHSCNPIICSQQVNRDKKTRLPAFQKWWELLLRSVRALNDSLWQETKSKIERIVATSITAILKILGGAIFVISK